MIIPNYLRKISSVVESSNISELVSMRCTCGNITFKVYENEKNQSRNVNSEILRIDGKLYYVKRNIFGKIKEKNEINQQTELERKVLMIKCEKCNESYDIFDNYLNGYDAQLNNLQKKNVKMYKKFDNMKVFVKIINDLSYEEFKSDIGNNDVSYETYLSSFSYIEVYGYDCREKRIKILSYETA